MKKNPGWTGARKVQGQDVDSGETPLSPSRPHTSRNLRLPRKAPLRLAFRVIRIAALGNTKTPGQEARFIRILLESYVFPARQLVQVGADLAQRGQQGRIGAAGDPSQDRCAADLPGVAQARADQVGGASLRGSKGACPLARPDSVAGG